MTKHTQNCCFFALKCGQAAFHIKPLVTLLTLRTTNLTFAVTFQLKVTRNSIRKSYNVLLENFNCTSFQKNANKFGYENGNAGK